MARSSQNEAHEGEGEDRVEGNRGYQALATRRKLVTHFSIAKRLEQGQQLPCEEAGRAHRMLAHHFSCKRTEDVVACKNYVVRPEVIGY